MPRELPRHLLAKGNYIRLAKSAVDPKYQGIGAVLVGNHREGLARLARAMPDAEVKYYQAVAHWSLNDMAAANAALDRADPRHAKLHAIINRKVRVLCQARHDGDASWCISSTLKKNPNFEVVTIGNMAMDDIQLGVNETMESVLDRLGDWRPDYYFIHMIEYRLIPLGVERAPFPVIFQSSDHRADYQQVMPVLDLCDGMLVLGEQAHNELSHATASRIFTYPKMFGIHFEDAMTNAASTKAYDVFWSGNMLDESLYDKATFFSHMADALADHHRFALCNGKTRRDEYYNLLSQARIVPSYIHREQDSFSSRALEAIAMGAITLVPAGNSIGLYFDEASGLVEFHPANAVSEIRRVLDNWDGYFEKTAQAGRMRALAEFNFPDVVDQLFKMLMLESLNMPIERRQPITPIRSSYRLYSRIEASDVFADPNRMLSYKAQNLERLLREIEQNPDIDLMSAAAHLAWSVGNKQIAIGLLERIHNGRPAHMGALFNLGFAYFYTQRKGDAESVFRKLTVLPAEDAEISSLFALFDSSSQIYLTHMMRDELSSHCFGGEPIDASLAYLKSVAHNFLASIHVERGEIPAAIDSFRSMQECFADNFIGQVNFGKMMLESGEASDGVGEGCAALLQAIETYRGYLLTDVFDLFAKRCNLNGEVTRLQESQRRLLGLITSGERLLTKGNNAWLALFGSESKSKAGVRQVRSAPPQLILEGYFGFNIVAYESKYFALAQNAGPIDLMRLSEQDIGALEQDKKCVISQDLDDIKQAIIERSPSAHVEQQLTRLRASLESGDSAGAASAIAILQDYAANDVGLASQLSQSIGELIRQLPQ